MPEVARFGPRQILFSLIRLANFSTTYKRSAWSQIRILGDSHYREVYSDCFPVLFDHTCYRRMVSRSNSSTLQTPEGLLYTGYELPCGNPKLSRDRTGRRSGETEF